PIIHMKTKIKGDRYIHVYCLWTVILGRVNIPYRVRLSALIHASGVLSQSIDVLLASNWPRQAHRGGRKSKLLQVRLQYFSCLCFAHSAGPLFITPGDDPGVVGQGAWPSIG